MPVSIACQHRAGNSIISENSVMAACFRAVMTLLSRSRDGLRGICTILKDGFPVLMRGYAYNLLELLGKVRDIGKSRLDINILNRQIRGNQQLLCFVNPRIRDEKTERLPGFFTENGGKIIRIQMNFGGDFAAAELVVVQMRLHILTDEFYDGTRVGLSVQTAFCLC